MGYDVPIVQLDQNMHDDDNEHDNRDWEMNIDPRPAEVLEGHLCYQAVLQVPF